ncbi:unnamed protein product [Caenorhabditis brenneri]
MNSIPFLRLPFLVIQEVFSMMSPFDIIHFSKVSKRSKRIVKGIINTRLHNKYQTEVYICDDYGIGFKSGERGWYYMYTSKRSHANRAVMEGTDHGNSLGVFQQKFTRNKLDGFKNYFNLCQDLSVDITGLDLDMDNVENKMIIDFLKTKQESFEWCEVCSSTERGEEIKHLLENLKITKNLCISPQISEDSETNLPKDVENLFFHSSKFVKLEQVLALKSKRIVLDSTKFTNEDISVLLKSWIASESNLNLEHLKIGGFGGRTSVPDGPDIKREDGKKARVIFARSALGTTLDMFVH